MVQQDIPTTERLTPSGAARTQSMDQLYVTVAARVPCRKARHKRPFMAEKECWINAVELEKEVGVFNSGESLLIASGVRTVCTSHPKLITEEAERETREKINFWF